MGNKGYTGLVNYNIKGTGLDITDELRSYVERGLAAAGKFMMGDGTAHTNIELEHHPIQDGPRYRAEFTATCGGEVHRAEARGETLHGAIDIASGALARELGRDKKKRLHTLRRTAVKVKEYLRGWRRKV